MNIFRWSFVVVWFCEFILFMYETMNTYFYAEINSNLGRCGDVGGFANATVGVQVCTSWLFDIPVPAYVPKLGNWGKTDRLLMFSTQIPIKRCRHLQNPIIKQNEIRPALSLGYYLQVHGFLLNISSLINGDQWGRSNQVLKLLKCYQPV